MVKTTQVQHTALSTVKTLTQVEAKVEDGDYDYERRKEDTRSSFYSFLLCSNNVIKYLHSTLNTIKISLAD